MSRRVGPFLLLCAFAGGVAACSFDRSGPAATRDASAVPDGEVVTPDGGADATSFDGAPPVSCDLACPSPASCVEEVCTFDCADANSCEDRIVCPPGIPCHVTCGQDACGEGIDCTAASRCVLECTGVDSCDDEVACAGSNCTVTCGQNACTGPVSCDAGACAINCLNVDACAGPVSCAGGACAITCGQNACKSEIDCTAGSCSIICNNEGACAGAITCGPGSCDVICGQNACANTVDCSDSCSCDVLCSQPGSCAGGVDCPGIGPTCETPVGTGCTSVINPVCQTCM